MGEEGESSERILKENKGSNFAENEKGKAFRGGVVGGISGKNRGGRKGKGGLRIPEIKKAAFDKVNRNPKLLTRGEKNFEKRKRGEGGSSKQGGISR